ncbi:MAG: hypothetical protein EPN37_04505 [Chitinophagaceae bacterium]|nr:MAG: hypothetical protein EPN37_04505 [Chitinophagaceae bacterium]
MSLPSVSIQLQNGLLGQVGIGDDGVAGLICSGPAPANLTLGAPVMITSVDQAINQYGISTTTNAYRHIKQFYDEAGTGAELYIMIVPSATTMIAMCDKTQAFAATLLTYGGGKIRLLGVAKDPGSGYVPVVTAGIDQDVLGAMTNADALAAQFQGEYKPVRILLEGSAFNDTVASLQDLTLSSFNHVGIVLGSDTKSGSGCVGLALGRAAKVPPQRNIGRVKDGPLTGITEAYLGSKTVDTDMTVGDLGTVNDKGYIFMRGFTGRSGFFWNDDKMAALPTDDYNSLARGRVIDKAIVIAYSTYVNEILDEIQVDSNGQISTAIIKSLQQLITNAINIAMGDEISGFQAFIDPTQNVIATGQLNIVMSITPVGYSKQIIVQLGFANPA